MFERLRSRACAGAAETTEAGSCQVRRLLRADVATVWEALTEPARVGEWFGVLTPGLRACGHAVLDFEDGDFFTIEDVRLRPPSRLEYTWRFLGIGPPDRITWELRPDDAGVVLTVLDESPDRPAAWTESLRDGWLDFTARLARHLRTGSRTRYAWRRELDATVVVPLDLPAARSAVLPESGRLHWLPLDGPVLRDGARLLVPEGKAALAFEVVHCRRESPGRVTFELTFPAWGSPTACRLEVLSRGRASVLCVNHTGWAALRGPSETRCDRRRLFSRFWIDLFTHLPERVSHAPTR